MFTSLGIEGFRGIKSLKINDIGRVNLLVGTNNCGKTTILEAVQFVANGATAYSIILSPGQRGEIEGKMTHPRYYINHLFWGHDANLGRYFEIIGNISQDKISIKCSIIPPTSPNYQQPKLPEANGTINISPSLSIYGKYTNKSDELSWEVPIINGIVALENIKPSMAPYLAGYIRPVQFITTFSWVPSIMRQIWDKITLTPEEGQIIEGLRIIEDDIERINFVSAKPNDMFWGNDILIKIKSFDKPIPLASMGEGLRRILALLLALVESSQGFCLIDEIDTGLHYSVMGKTWEMVIKTAIRLDIQVFATTHSYDCVRSLARLYKENPNLQKHIRLHRIEKDREQSVVYTSEELYIASREDMEVR